MWWWLAVGNTACVWWWLAVGNTACVWWWLAVGNTACVVVVSSREYCMCGGG